MFHNVSCLRNAVIRVRKMMIAKGKKSEEITEILEQRQEEV